MKQMLFGILFTLGLCVMGNKQSLANSTPAGIAQTWTDAVGQPISAHEGGISRFGDEYYWYGTSYRGNPDGAYGVAGHKLANGFNVYESKDLKNWTCQGVCLAIPTNGWGASGTLHRPFVFFNAKTRQYVMWFFQFTATYPDAMLGVAVADSPAGPFHIVGHRNSGEEHGWAQDLGGLQDNDGHAYIVYDDGHRNLRVNRLTEDYLDVSGQGVIALKSPPECEGAAMTKWRGKYIVAGSGVHGWNGSDTQYAVADQPLGPYGPPRLMNPVGTATWQSQISNFFPGLEPDSVYALCDRWWFKRDGTETHDLEQSSYLFLPLRQNSKSGEFQLDYDRRLVPPDKANIAASAHLLPAAHTFAVGAEDFLLDGMPFQIKAGEMHPARVPHQYWADRLRMIHAMGLNTVSIYVFWNQHEPHEGEFNFKGDADIAQFVRLAQKEGLWVILRPGPYCCAEWEFGGYPWWLLKQHDLKIRSQDPRFLAAAETYMKKLGEQLAPLQITHGGPIILVQVENEYGSYGSDHSYMGKILDLDRAAGFDVPFFTADGGGNMMVNGHLPEVLPGLNGGSGPDIMKEIGKYRPNGPWFVPELYPGWLDHWGEPHAQIGIEDLVGDTEWKLTNHVSFCYYMIYGGTSFGFMNGANYGDHFQPQPTSYDYDAPMDEAGWPTKKYYALREVFTRHLTPGEVLPEVPAMKPVIEIPKIEFTSSASVFDLLGKPVKSERPLSFEDLDQGYGYVLYRSKICGPVDAILKLKELRDYAVVCVDGKRVTTLDRRLKQDYLALVITNTGATLDILVENSGRINYGGELSRNRKGITESVMLGDRELTGWEMFKLPFDKVPKVKTAHHAANTAPFVAHGTFALSQTGDTFLDLRGWGKGIVFVNGHNLGRYWNIGPQQTLYCPGVWLKEGRNEIVVFEQIKDGIQELTGIASPILDQLN